MSPSPSNSARSTCVDAVGTYIIKFSLGWLRPIERMQKSPVASQLRGFSINGKERDSNPFARICGPLLTFENSIFLLRERLAAAIICSNQSQKMKTWPNASFLSRKKRQQLLQRIEERIIPESGTLDSLLTRRQDVTWAYGTMIQ